MPAAIARQADRYRDTRNALAHNPDIALRPEAAPGSSTGLRASCAWRPARPTRSLATASICVATTELAVVARDTMLAHRYNQLVVVDARGGVVDLLTERDLVAAEAPPTWTATATPSPSPTPSPNAGTSPPHCYRATPQSTTSWHALRDEAIVAAVVTEHGQAGERPLGIITRGDVLKLL